MKGLFLTFFFIYIGQSLFGNIIVTVNEMQANI